MGIVGAPFGLEGFVKLRPFSGETAHFSGLKKVIIRQNGKEYSRDIAESRPRGDYLLIHFSGIDSPEAAAALKGAELIAGRESAAPLNEGEYYVEDLKGLNVVNANAVILGHIDDVIEGGGGQLAEVTFPGGKKHLVPFRKEFFGDVSFENNTIELLETWILETPGPQGEKTASRHKNKRIKPRE